MAGKTGITSQLETARSSFGGHPTDQMHGDGGITATMPIASTLPTARVASTWRRLRTPQALDLDFELNN
jgi:hypothetical protein